MPTFGASSLKNLQGVDERLVKICKDAISVMDFTVLDGLRTEEEQKVNVEAGKSWTMKSKHLEGKAVDLAPWPIHWADHDMFCVLAGVMRAIATCQGVKIRWGGDWNRNDSTLDEKHRDFGHFEIDEP